MANLAIKGHKTRGSEVIAWLAMLGGKNIYGLTGTKEIWYILSDGTIEHSTYIFDEKGFALEEFLEKFPYKVGDKVTHDMGILMNVVHMCWDAECNVIRYDIQSPVDNNYKLKAMLAEHLQPYKEETMDRKYNVEEYLKVWEETEKGLEVVVNDNFELKEEKGKFYIIKKQPRYPKTYKECCKVFCCKPIVGFAGLDDNEENLYGNFIALKRCRDAYWKIAGDWEPDWCNDSQFKYIITCRRGNIIKDSYTAKNCILAFPTEEMRDAFYENFKELIENVKELL